MLFIAFVVLYIKETHKGGKTKVTYHFIIFFYFVEVFFYLLKVKIREWVLKSAKLKIQFMKSTKKHGLKPGDYLNLIFFASI